MSAYTKFTRGPWMVDGEDRIERTGNLGGMWIAKRGKDGECAGRVAKCFANCLVTTDAAVVANANLIAAAPELYALAEKYASECAECDGTGSVVVKAYGIDPDNVDCPSCADIRATLAKARGEA